MKTCKKCGETKSLGGFYSDTSRPDGRHPYCAECKKVNAKIYLKNNYDQVYSRVQEWKQNNRDKDRAYKSAWKKRNPDKVRAEHRRRKNWHCEYTRRWRVANPERDKNTRQRRIAKKNSLARTFTEREWYQLLDLFDNSCAYCGKTGDLHRDHFIPIALDGPFVMGNIVPACPFCNQSKNANHPKEWIPERYEEISRKIRMAEHYSEVT